jgi:hypothetical protein
MTDLVSVFVKAAQSFFVQIRNLEASYIEEISEVAHAHLTNLSVATITAATELKQVFPPLHIFKYCTHCAAVYFHFWADNIHTSLVLHTSLASPHMRG